MNQTQNSIYDFSRTISRPTLEAYLSRSITMTYLLQGYGYPEDNLRMIANIGAKFIGRSLYLDKFIQSDPRLRKGRPLEMVS